MEIALVGIGKIAVDQHVPAIAASDEWSLAATVSRQGAVEGVTGYTNFDQMLAERPDIRVVSLCVPPGPRFDYAVAALRAGRHVMLEKPPGATLAECYQLEALARENRVALFATWHSREAAGVAQAKEWLIGKRLRRLSVTWREDVHRWHPGQAWIWEPAGMGVFDPGINALSIVTEILPDPIHLTSADLDIPSNCQTPIGARLNFYHPHGAEVTADFDWRQTGDQIWTIDVETDQGTLSLLNGGATVVIDGQQIDMAGTNTLSGEYPRLYRRMAELVRQGGVDVDLSPMIHVTDALALGRRTVVDPFFD